MINTGCSEFAAAVAAGAEIGVADDALVAGEGALGTAVAFAGAVVAFEADVAFEVATGVVVDEAGARLQALKIRQNVQSIKGSDMRRQLLRALRSLAGDFQSIENRVSFRESRTKNKKLRASPCTCLRWVQAHGNITNIILETEAEDKDAHQFLRKRGLVWYNIVAMRWPETVHNQHMIYQNYAPFYDMSGQLRFAVLMGQYLTEVLARHVVRGQRALDIACGTGTLALMLADQGWDVVGLDASLPMLTYAQAKATNLEVDGRVTFVQGDMRDLNSHVAPFIAGTTDIARDFQSSMPGSRYDLVTCIYDSLNYLLTKEDLAACFNSVSRVLLPGGLFVADMNTRYFLEHDWGDCAALECPGFVQITQSHFDPVTGCSTMVLTGFAGDDEHGYDRFDETHIERAYPEDVVGQLLAEAGLVVEASYDCFTFQPVQERTQRIAWIARKPDSVQ